MNNSLLRALAFRRACETAPLHVAQNELIVSHPAGGARGGEVSPEISWRWLADELETLPARAQDHIRLMRKQSVCFAKKYSHTGRAVPSMKWRKRS